MKYILAILVFAVLILSGCGAKYVCPDGTIVNDMIQCPEEQEKTADTGTQNVDQTITSGEFTMKVGDSVMCEGKTLKLLTHDKYANFGVSVDDMKTTIQGTKTLEIVNGVTLKIRQHIYSETKPEGNNVLIECKKFELGADEYLLFVGEKVTIDGTNFLLEQIDMQNKLSMLFDGNQDVELMPGVTDDNSNTKVAGWKITNIQAFPKHDYQKDNYAIIKIVKG
ncbi:hypothetical protein J4468_01010 [Candidatus Woesearchaeota archaeon]|nr:hypothetical protein [Candidatus Woesearchaeota archaeon]